MIFKQVTTSVAEAGAREVLNSAASQGTGFLLNQFKPLLASSIRLKVENKFYGSELIPLLRYMFALDVLKKSKNLSKRINHEV